MNVKQPHESIETLLKEARPQLNSAFEQQLEDKLLLLLEQGCADSETEHDNSKENIIMLGNGFAQNKHGLRYKLAAAVITLFVVSVTVVTIPPLRALAQEIIDTIFVRAESDTRDRDYLDYDYQMVTSIHEAEEIAEFEIAAPAYLPGAVTFYHATITSFDDDSVFVELLYYETVQVNLRQKYSFEVLSISQAQGYAESQWWQTYGGIPVGASAEIETIMLNDIEAQYLRGGWKFDTDSPSRTWDNDYYKHILAWQQNGFLFAVVAATMITDKDEMIAVAETAISEYLDVFSTHPPEQDSTDTIFVHLGTDTQELGDDFVFVPAYEYEPHTDNKGIETIADAEEVVGFDVVEPVYFPYAAEFDWVSIDLPGYKSSIGAMTEDVSVSHGYKTLFYQVSITQKLLDPESEEHEILFYEVGASAEIETITIGDVEAQYVIGYWDWASDMASGTAEWVNSDNVQRIAWWQDGFRFEIYSWSFGYGSKRELVAIAESMILGDDFSPPDWVNPPILVNVDGDSLSVVPVELHLGDNRNRTAHYGLYHAYSRSASLIAAFKDIGTELLGYQLIEPVFVPDWLDLFIIETLTQSSSVVSRSFSPIIEVGTLLTYRDADDEHYLTIVQMVVGTENVDGWWQEHGGLPVGASAEIETIEIGDTTAYYVQGGWQRENNARWHLPGEWDNDFPRHTLAWWQDGYLMSIVTRATDRISKDDLIAIAESMIESTK
jgi:hypothetical protein